MDAFKIPLLCLLAALIIVFLKQYKSEYAMLTALAAGVVVLGLLLGYAAPLLEQLYGLADRTAAADYFKTALKALGISYITAFAADSCRDFGQSALAAKAELAGRCAVFLLSLPLLSAVLELALGFVRV